MGSSLQFVVVVPAGGGKTTLSQKEQNVFLDIDALYNLREAQSTYDRMNAELERRAAVRQPVPKSVASDLRHRIANYEGPARCLLLHSLTLAKACGLQIVAALIPTRALHESFIAERQATGKWFARQNVECLIQSCQQSSTRILRYSTWAELENIVEHMLSVLPESTQDTSEPCTETPTLTREQQDRDEALLLGMCTLAIGCDFEEVESRASGCGENFPHKSETLRLPVAGLAV